MKVTYIYHSSFLTETQHIAMLFDYYRGTLPEVDPEKAVYIFASHRHEDHFSTDIFKLARKYPKAWFVLSNDIWKKRVPTELLERTSFIGPGEHLELGEGTEKIGIETLKSTDEGVAFLVEAEGKTVYHAGDLNDWYWEGEPQSWNDRVGEDYRKEIDRLAERFPAGPAEKERAELEPLSVRKLDVAFVVLDGRQGKDFRLGMDYFLQNVGVRTVFPIHFWERYRVIADFKRLPEAKPYLHVVRDMARPGQVFEV